MKKYFILLGVLIFAAVYQGCTNLDVVPLNTLTRENFYENKEQVMGALMRPYVHARDQMALGGILNEKSDLTTDQIIWPQKGRHGYDGGDWGRLHYHNWRHLSDEPQIRNMWNNTYTIIGYCNNVIEDFEVLDFPKLGLTNSDRDGYILEMRALRAWAYLKLVDLFGNIPIVTKVGEPLSPTQVSRAEAFKWVEDELLDVAGSIQPLTRGTANRMTKASVYATLVQLYLNAEEWTGTARWDDCIRYSDMIISGAGGSLGATMALDPDIDVTFSNTNSARSVEAIWMGAYNENQGTTMSRANSASYNERDMFNSRNNGNNGVVTQAGAFFNYKEKDLRRHSWFYYGIGNGYGGYNHQGPYKDIGRIRNDYVLGTEEYINLPIIFCFKPIKAVIEVSGSSSDNPRDRTITITEWYSPEFPEEFQKLLMQDAFNAADVNTVCKGPLCIAYDRAQSEGRKCEIFISGSYEKEGVAPQYPWSVTPDGKAINDFRHMWQDCKENTGARHWKYKPGLGDDPNYYGNWVIIHRLTDVYFAKAEALMRKNGNTATQEAVDLINATKKRAFLPEYWDSQEAVDAGDRYTTATLTMDELLTESGREFFWEGKRRAYLIRFGKYDFGLDNWWDATGDYENGSGGTLNREVSRRLMPIPYNAMEANPNLVQNPGYN